MLLTLPPELRNRVYELALTVAPNSDGKVKVGSASSTRPSVLAVLQSCRQIRNEAEGRFYYSHDLQLDWIATLNFLENTSAKRRQAIRTVTVAVDSPEQATAVMKQLRYTTRLKSLHFELHPHPYDGSDLHRGFLREDHILKKVLPSLGYVENFSLHAVPSPLWKCVVPRSQLEKWAASVQQRLRGYAVT